jgi:hypothetical protein
MSYWSTLKNIFRTPRRLETPFTISIIFPDGSGAFDYPVFLPPSVANMLLSGRQPQCVEIWKLYVPQSDIGRASTDRLRLCQVLSFPQNPSPAPVGLHESKQSASGWRL